MVSRKVELFRLPQRKLFMRGMVENVNVVQAPLI